MSKILLTFQLTDDCIAITDSFGGGSTLMVDGECITYTLKYDTIINHAQEIQRKLSGSREVLTRGLLKKGTKDGLRIIELDNGDIRMFFNGEAASICEGVLYRSTRFDMRKFMAVFNTIYTQIPRESPTFEGTGLRARYLRDGNLVIINTDNDCIVFNKSSLNNGVIDTCLLNSSSYKNLRIATADADSKITILTEGNETVFCIDKDAAVEKYLPLADMCNAI